MHVGRTPFQNGSPNMQVILWTMALVLEVAYWIDQGCQNFSAEVAVEIAKSSPIFLLTIGFYGREDKQK